MADAEKKDIARLDFKIDDAKSKLNEINTLLNNLATESESYARRIGASLNNSVDVSKMINTEQVKQKFTTITGYTTQFGQKMKYTLSGQVDFSKMIDVDVVKKDLANLQTIGKSGAKKLGTTIVTEETKVAANRTKLRDQIAAKEKSTNLDIIKSEQTTADKIKVINENQVLEKIKGQNKILLAQEEGEQKRQTAAYKSMLKQEEYNNRLLKSTKTLYDKITDYAKTYVLYQGFNQLKQAASEVIEEMKDVEFRVMEISRIMEDGTINVNEYRDSLIDLAYNYGRSFDDVSTVTLNFARAGYDAQDSIAMTEKALLALNTAELDAEQATDGLISIMAQWNMNSGTTEEKAQNLMDIIDKINKTADKFPISSEGLLEALQRTSQGFNLAGATIDETIAMIVAAEKASQRGGKVIGTAMSNMQNQLKAEGKLDIAKELGLDFFEDEAETEFKSITEIFATMSERMAELESAGKGSSTEMQKLLELFTVFRRNIGAGLLSEMSGEDSTYMEALQNAAESAGYSIQENTKYMDTMEAATQQMKATILDLESTLYDEGGKSIFTGFILGAEGGVKAVNSLIESFGILPTTIAAVTLGFGLLNKKMNYEGLKKYTSNLKDLSAAFDLYNTQVKTGAETTDDLYTAMGSSATSNVKKYIDSLDGADASMKGYIASTVTATAKQVALNLVVAAGEAAISFGLSLAIQAIVGVINDWINATHNAAESIQDMNDKIDETVSDLSTYTSKVETLRKEIDSKKLTEEEEKAALDDLLEIQNKLIQKYGEEAEGIDLVNGKLDEQIAKIEDLAKAKYNAYKQENQKEINTLAKTFDKNITKKTTLSIGGQIVGKDFASEMEDILGTKIASKGQTIEQTGVLSVTGKPDEVLEKYQELFEKLQEYSNENYHKLTEHEKSYLNSSINNISETIKKLNEKYSEDYQTYQTYLNNKLQYDQYYSTVYGKILEARANLATAIASGDDEKIEEAQEKVKNVYAEAIEEAKKDPQVSEGMVDLLNEQLDNLNKSTDKEQIKLKIGVDAEEIHDSIQDIIDDMGDISFEDLKEGLNAEEATENIQKLKDKLNECGVSVEDFTDDFEYLGFTTGEVKEEVESASDTLSYLEEKVQESIDNLAALDSGFTSVYNAMDEFNQNGYITGSTLQGLINNDLLQYFDVVNGKLAVNEAAMVNAATATKAKAIEDLQAKAAAEIAAIAFDTESSAAGTAESTTSGMTEKTKEVKAALSNMTPEVLNAADAWTKLNSAMGGSMEGLAEDKVNQIQQIMNNLSKSITAVNSVKIEAVSYRRTTAQSSGSSSSSSSSSKSDEEKAAEEAAKAAEEAYKARLEAFEDYVDEKERLEKRWVDKQKELGQLSNEDFLYITQQRIERYKKYLEEVKNATWLSEEDRLSLIQEYSEKIEDLQVDYLGYLQDQLDDEIEAIEDANEEKIKLIEEEAEAKINALKKVEDARDRDRDKEDYEKERQSILDEISYWEQRTGREAQEALKEAKEKLEELDAEWEDQLEDWSIEDQIQAIEDERDAQISAIEDAQEAEIASIKAVYDAKVKLFAETGEIIYENSVMQSQALYNAYKTNFIDPISSELTKLNEASTATAPTTTTTEATQQYETYTIKSGDTLSKIAKQYGTTVDKIMAANPYVTNKNKIYAGKTLQIPKFHEGGIYGGNYEEGLALLKKGEVVLKPSWAASLDRMMKHFDNVSAGTTNISNGSNIEVNGDLIKIEANVRSQSDIDLMTKKIEKVLKDKFNIKK